MRLRGCESKHAASSTSLLIPTGRLLLPYHKPARFGPKDVRPSVPWYEWRRLATGELAEGIFGGPTENWKGNGESMDRDGSLSGGAPSLPCCGGGVPWDKVRQPSTSAQLTGVLVSI